MVPPAPAGGELWGDLEASLGRGGSLEGQFGGKGKCRGLCGAVWEKGKGQGGFGRQFGGQGKGRGTLGTTCMERSSAFSWRSDSSSLERRRIKWGVGIPPIWVPP